MYHALRLQGYISAEEFLNIPELSINPLARRLERLFDTVNFKVQSLKASDNKPYHVQNAGHEEPSFISDKSLFCANYNQARAVCPTGVCGLSINIQQASNCRGSATLPVFSA